VPVTTQNDAVRYDELVVPRYNAHFARLLLEHLDVRNAGMLLDAGCGTGLLTLALCRRLRPGGRVVAVDRHAGRIAIARRRAIEHDGTRAFFKVAALEDTRFGDGVFDAAAGNLVLHDIDAPDQFLRELRRTLAPRGKLALSRPLRGTFDEVVDMLQEIGHRDDNPSLLARLAEHTTRYPSASDLARLVENAGFRNVSVADEVFRLPFPNAKALFTDPLVEHVGLPEWRWIVGVDRAGAGLMAEVERALDTYFATGPVSLTVRAGVVTATRD
jgi:ubiquinone/menaquinone biosynthesis C-methylase UbiE